MWDAEEESSHYADDCVVRMMNGNWFWRSIWTGGLGDVDRSYFARRWVSKTRVVLHNLRVGNSHIPLTPAS